MSHFAIVRLDVKIPDFRGHCPYYKFRKVETYGFVRVLFLSCSCFVRVLCVFGGLFVRVL